MSALDLSPLFDPKGVLVAGASTHPGKFGFVVLHNILSCGYRGNVFATNLEGEHVLGVPVFRDADELPDDSIDLVFVCTPAAANVELLRTCAKKGARAAFVTSAGYGETGDEGRRLEQELADTAAELGMVLAGPNGQGVISTPSSLCAQIVAPYPPPGRIGIASQSGNFVSSFQNLARQSGVGVSRSVSVGNAAVLAVPDYFDYLRDDPACGDPRLRRDGHRRPCVLRAGAGHHHAPAPRGPEGRHERRGASRRRAAHRRAGE